MIEKFVLIGLPGVGKSTTMKECAEIIKLKLGFCVIKSTDEIIRSRFNSEDHIIKKFEEKIDKKIPEEVFKADKPSSAFIKIFGEEPLFRDLEEMFVQDILNSSKNTDWFDLGGKAPLREGVKNALSKNRVIPIFLYASHTTILERLSTEDNWKKRGNYLIEGINGWQKLAENHRSERVEKYNKCASIVLSVENENVIENEVILLKTPEELAQEIFYRVAELKQACFSRNNFFTSSNKVFFEPEKKDLLNTINLFN